MAQVRKEPERRPEPAPPTAPDPRTCEACGARLSSYNPGPNCWQHTMGHPWRGPSAKPRF